MKTEKGIHVDLIDASTRRVPLDVVTVDTIFVKMPHGNFEVRIVAPQPTNVAVRLDDVELVKCQVGQGMTFLKQSADGKPFRFTAPGKRSAAAPDTVSEGEPASPPAHTHGLVLVSVQLAEQAPTPTTAAVKADKAETVAFQMNPLREHLRVVAAQLHRVIAPEPLTPTGCSCCPQPGK